MPSEELIIFWSIKIPVTARIDSAQDLMLYFEGKLLNLIKKEDWSFIENLLYVVLDIDAFSDPREIVHQIISDDRFLVLWYKLKERFEGNEMPDEIDMYGESEAYELYEAADFESIVYFLSSVPII